MKLFPQLNRIIINTRKRRKGMSGFFLTPMTRFYVEALQNMKNTGAGSAVSGLPDTAGMGSAVSGRNNGGMAGQAGASSFADTVNEKLSQKEGNVSGNTGITGVRNEAMVQAMSREEYKFYIYQKIAGIPMHPSQKWDAVMVNISEEGFAAMQADPAYEKWVLDTLRRDFAAYNPWSDYAGGRYRIHYFGATREEYRGESFPMGFRGERKRTNSSKKKEKSYWEKRAERHKWYTDLAQKAWYKHENDLQYQETIDIQRKEVSSALLRQWAIERATGEEVELGIDPSVLSQAATDYAQGYVFFKIPSARMNPRPKSAR